MLKMNEKDENKESDTADMQDSYTGPAAVESVSGINGKAPEYVRQSFLQSIKSILRGKNDTSLREAIEEYIEEADNGEEIVSSVTSHERVLLSNILKLRDMTVTDVMIPRADIAAIDIGTSQKELLSLLSQKQFSRIPVYRNTLDEVVGTIHIKDVLALLAKGKKVNISELIREVPIISPSMHVLDLLLMMRELRKHMMLVVDEYGGIDGLVTIGDVVESIVGEIDDEYDQSDEPHIMTNNDGTVYASGRVNIEDLEKEYGAFLNDDEREDIDTLGGLVFALAGRVPARGEILTHESGLVFEVIDADPRRVSRLQIKNLSLLS